MNKLLAEKTAAALEELGFVAKVVADYSGRGMKGTTAGIVTHASPVLVGFAVAKAVLNGGMELHESLHMSTLDVEDRYYLDMFDFNELPRKSDSLGLHMIYY